MCKQLADAVERGSGTGANCAAKSIDIEFVLRLSERNFYYLNINLKIGCRA